MSKGFDGRDVSHRISHTDWNTRCSGNRDDILHLLRGRMEREHRCLAIDSVWCNAKSYTISAGKYKPVVMQHLYESYRLYEMMPNYNKSVMIYTLDPNREAKDIGTGILKYLNIWLYRQWFKPYQSDIEFGRYIAKTTLLRWKREHPKPSLDDISRFHKSLCHDLTSGMFENMSPRVRNYMKTNQLNIKKRASKKWTLAAFNRSYTVQPTFQSFFIVMQRTHGFVEGPFRADEIGNIPVHLVCTMCNNKSHSRGASHDTLGPCCTIQTTMKAAIRFIMDLEEKNSTIRTTVKPGVNFWDHPLDLEQEAKDLGWDVDKHGKLPLDQSSSTWVDKNKYTEWTGAGAKRHISSVFCCIKYLKTARRRVPLEDNWWWYESSLDTVPGTKSNLSKASLYSSCLLVLFGVCLGIFVCSVEDLVSSSTIDIFLQTE